MPAFSARSRSSAERSAVTRMAGMSSRASSGRRRSPTARRLRRGGSRPASGRACVRTRATAATASRALCATIGRAAPAREQRRHAREDLLVVVDAEHRQARDTAEGATGGCAGCAATGAAAASGTERLTRVPRPGTEFERDADAEQLGDALDDGEPEPEARRDARARIQPAELLEDQPSARPARSRSPYPRPRWRRGRACAGIRPARVRAAYI